MKRGLHGLIVVLATFGILGAWDSPAAACTGIRIKPKDGSVICARSMEFALNFSSNLIVVPRQYDLVGTGPGNQPGLRWRSKYAAVGANAFNMPIVADGLGEKGLGVGAFYLPGYAKYQTVAAGETGKALAPWELPLYLLSTCASVPEALAAVREVRVCEVANKNLGFCPPLHFVIHDAEGRCCVLEYIDGQLKVHDNPLGVITNSPAFDWHLTNLCNYVNLTVNSLPPVKMAGLTFSGLGQGSGMLGLPGDFTPPSRFVRAVAFSQAAVPVATAREGVLQAFHILNQFDIPRGSARSADDGKVMSDYTLWTSASDLKNLRYYIHTFQDRRIRMVDLKQVDLDAKRVKTISLGQEEDIENLSNIAK